MTTRSASAAPPATPTAAPSTGSEAPWSAQAAQELLAKAEHDRNYWKREAGRLKEALVVASAALSDKQDRVSFMERGVSHFYREVAALREKLKRWDKRNWTELCIAALKGGEADQLDYTVDIRDCVSFREALKDIHRQRDESNLEWLQGHAFRGEKQILAKMAHRISARRTGWQNSLFKFDHSARDPTSGKPLRKREKMNADSSVNAPELFNPKVLRAIVAKEMGSDGPVHVEQADRNAASVRDVAATMLQLISGAASTAWQPLARWRIRIGSYLVWTVRVYLMLGLVCVSSCFSVRSRK